MAVMAPGVCLHELCHGGHIKPTSCKPTNFDKSIRYVGKEWKGRNRQSMECSWLWTGFCLDTEDENLPVVCLEPSCWVAVLGLKSFAHRRGMLPRVVYVADILAEPNFSTLEIRGNTWQLFWWLHRLLTMYIHHQTWIQFNNVSIM